MNNKVVRNITIFAACFAVVVVVLGAFTRLTDAGLGCPDWPGCYGFMHIPTHDHHIEAANQAFPEQPYEFAKAWPEMVHRYFAGTLGLIVLGLAIISWVNREKFAIKHSTGLLLLIIFQAALGMWTVTLKLHPSVVMSHLLGGFAMLSLIAALALRYHYKSHWPLSYQQVKPIKMWTIVALIVLTFQIALGGWTSANYAALVCHELPVCQGNWFTEGHYLEGFQLWGREADTYEFGVLEQNARIAIHASHRVGAMVATLALGWLIFLLFKQQTPLLKRFASILSVLLFIQIVLGVNNIVMKLPLFNAVAHNAVGALLAVTMVCLLTLVMMAPKNTQEVAKHV